MPTPGIGFDTKMRPLVVPTVSIGGTSRQALLDDYLVAVHAITIAEQAVGQTWPHGRDYHAQQPGVDRPSAINRASEQHRDRIDRLARIRRELEIIIEGIDAQEGR